MTQELLSELFDIYTSSEILLNKIQNQQDFLSIGELFDFPRHVYDVLSKLLDDPNIYEIEECDIESKFLINSEPIIDKDSLIDFGFTDLTEDVCVRNEIPKEYLNKTAATYRYNAVINRNYTDGSMETIENQYFYDYCLDVDPELSSSETWNTVNEQDVVFKNEYCKIYNPKKYES